MGRFGGLLDGEDCLLSDYRPDGLASMAFLAIVPCALCPVALCLVSCDFRGFDATADVAS